MTVKSVTDDEITFEQNGGFTELNNLSETDFNIYVLKRNKTLKLKTKTLDAGSTIEIKFVRG